MKTASEVGNGSSGEHAQASLDGSGPSKPFRRIGEPTERPDWPLPHPLTLPRAASPPPAQNPPRWAKVIDPVRGVERVEAAITDGGYDAAPIGWWSAVIPPSKVDRRALLAVAFLLGPGIVAAALPVLSGSPQPGGLVVAGVFLALAGGFYYFLRLDLADRRARSSRSFLNLGQAGVSIGEIAAAIDQAIKASFPEVRCVIPPLAREGVWRQEGREVDLSLLYGTSKRGPSLKLEAVRSDRVVGVLKGVLERTLYGGVILADNRETSLLREAGRAANSTPDPKEPLAFRLVRLPKLAFLGGVTLLFALGALAVALRTVVLPLVGAGPWGSAVDYYLLVMATIVAFIMGFATQGERKNPKGSKISWPPAGVLRLESPAGISPVEYRIQQGEPDFQHFAIQRRTGREPWQTLPVEAALRELQEAGPVGRWLADVWRFDAEKINQMYAGTVGLMEINMARDQVARRQKLKEAMTQFHGAMDDLRAVR